MVVTQLFKLRDTSAGCACSALLLTAARERGVFALLGLLHAPLRPDCCLIATMFFLHAAPYSQVVRVRNRNHRECRFHPPPLQQGFVYGTSFF